MKYRYIGPKAQMMDGPHKGLQLVSGKLFDAPVPGAPGRFVVVTPVKEYAPPRTEEPPPETRDKVFAPDEPVEPTVDDVSV